MDAFAGLLGVDENDMLKPGQSPSQRFDLAPIKRFGRNQDARVADFHAGRDRLWPEGGEERRDDAFHLQRTQNGDIKLRNAAE